MEKKPSCLALLIAVILVLCCCLIIVLSGVLYLWQQAEPLLPTIEFSTSTPTPFQITRQPVSNAEIEMLQTLQNTVIPVRDLADLACRFKGICNAPETLEPPAVPYTIGAQRQFWLANSDDGTYSRITATLHYMTPHAYFWVEDGVDFDMEEARKLIDTFEEKIYPTDRAFFGSEWTPGVDNDPHLYIIYAQNLGMWVAGFYVSVDEYNPLIVEHSNGIEAFYIDSSQDLGDEYTYSTLAHEFQHMIHWYQDMNESSFLDEGFSELASFLNGYDTGGFDWTYTNDPDIPLTDWNDTDENSAHYGANFLFVTYFLDRFGEEATQALIHNPQNELDSVDSTLQQLGITDPLTGQPITADDFFLDWVLTNYIQDERVADGRYTYHIYPSAPQASDTEWVTSCPQTGNTRTVNQYGVDYIRITCTGEFTVSFRGSTVTRLLSENPHSGNYAFWSNKANESNTSLMRSFDLSNVSGPVTLEYWTWFDLESDYDYAYVSASTDQIHWDILVTPSGVPHDPSKDSYGWGYTGKSDGWVQETVDLSPYAGQTVWLRFDYVTDAAVVEQGLMLDDISIPAINYFEDFENGDGGWEAAGFVRVRNTLPQSFRLALIHRSGNQMDVEILPPDPDQSFDINIKNENGEEVVLVVTATARFTHEPATYQFEIK